MKLLDIIIQEYIAIVDFWVLNDGVENDRIIVEREEFRKALERNAYMTFSEKTKIYKNLNFIIHDKNNYTMPYKDKEQKKTIRKVIINYKAYQTIKHLYETVANI